MARFRRISALVAALRRSRRVGGDIGEARRWYCDEALARYARALPGLVRLAEGIAR
jgi:hypothetical protein